jgi:hypothetical protein
MDAKLALDIHMLEGKYNILSLSRPLEHLVEDKSSIGGGYLELQLS